MIFLNISSIVKVLSLLLFLHPIHVSVTEIEFDEKDKALEIMMRVFIDDLELTLRNELKQPELDILAPKNGKTNDQIIGDYLKEHFKIQLDSKLQKTQYLGHEQEGDAFILYVEVTNVKKWKTIQIMNDIMTDTHEDQSNLVHVTVKGNIKSLRLTQDTPADELTFDSK
jgi:hypothetical protein